MKITKIIPFLFPLLIVILGLIIYKGFEYKPNLYTIFVNVGLAYLLSPRIKYLETLVKHQAPKKDLDFYKILIQIILPYLFQLYKKINLKRSHTHDMLKK